ncbi:hypothetical protein TD95_000479 [Thielaviopsis punctulata]|uniref:DUF7727 domain-containing protein n=1 Tax=Thielaviopsis punctulata TaxID=72032 RepID=A0A0F4ZA26_9PEZI|nr:hypothetical protein TD95_000479 [Thielaviopsis punctulata]
MGRLIKNHWARLIMLTASFYQFAAGIHGIFWPKILWDFLTHSLNGAVKPAPILQIINIILGIFMFALEWPLPLFAGTALHRSIEFRLAFIPLTALAAVLLYQGPNAALYYLVGMVAYFWAFSEGEIICKEPWTLPKRGGKGTVRV